MISTDEFIEFKDQAIFDEHEDDKRPEPLNRVDRRLLEKIAANTQKRIDDTGDACPIIVGHTSKHEPRPVVGWAKNFRVGLIGALRQRWAIIADIFIRKDQADVAKDFPRKSAEVWPRELVIDPIALLGGETPHRDIGVLAYSREEPFTFSNDDAQALCEAIAALPVFSQAHDVLRMKTRKKEGAVMYSNGFDKSRFPNKLASEKWREGEKPKFYQAADSTRTGYGPDAYRSLSDEQKQELAQETDGITDDELKEVFRLVREGKRYDDAVEYVKNQRSSGVVANADDLKMAETTPATKDDATKAVTYSRQHGVSYEQALTTVKANRLAVERYRRRGDSAHYLRNLKTRPLSK